MARTRLPRRTRDRYLWSRAAWLPVAVCVTMSIWFAWIDRVPHYDVAVFLRAATTVLAGHDPYPRPGTPAVYSGFAFVYPYVVAWLFTPLSWLSRSAAEDVFIAASVAALVAGCRLLRVRELSVYALVLTMSYTVIGLQMGSLNAFLFCAVAGVWRFRDRPVVAVPLLIFVIVSKLFLAPLTLWLLFTRRWTSAFLTAFLAGLILVAGCLLGPLTIRGYATLLSSLGAHEASLGQSTVGLFLNMGIGMRAAVDGSRVLAVVVIIVTARRARQLRDERLLFTGCLASALILSPVVWNHYLVLLTVPLMIQADRPDGPKASAAVALAAVYSWLVVTPHHVRAASVAVGITLVTFLAVRTLHPIAVEAARRGQLPSARQIRRLSVMAAVILAGFVAVEGTAAAYGDAGAVVGRYFAQLAVLAVLVHGWRSGASLSQTQNAEAARRGCPSAGQGMSRLEYGDDRPERATSVPSLPSGPKEQRPWLSRARVARRIAQRSGSTGGPSCWGAELAGYAVEDDRHPASEDVVGRGGHIVRSGRAQGGELAGGQGVEELVESGGRDRPGWPVAGDGALDGGGIGDEFDHCCRSEGRLLVGQSGAQEQPEDGVNHAQHVRPVGRPTPRHGGRQRLDEDDPADIPHERLDIGAPPSTGGLEPDLTHEVINDQYDQLVTAGDMPIQRSVTDAAAAEPVGQRPQGQRVESTLAQHLQGGLDDTFGGEAAGAWPAPAGSRGPFRPPPGRAGLGPRGLALRHVRPAIVGLLEWLPLHRIIQHHLDSMRPSAAYCHRPKGGPWPHKGWGCSHDHQVTGRWPAGRPHPDRWLWAAGTSPLAHLQREVSPISVAADEPVHSA